MRFRARSRQASILGRLRINTEIDCTPANADVVVETEVLIGSDGVGRSTRVISVTPGDHPLRDKAIAAATQPRYFAPGYPPETIESKVPFCQHPMVSISAYGPCPPRAELERRAVMRGYRIKSVYSQSVERSDE
jgi:hypothetical protein